MWFRKKSPSKTAVTTQLCSPAVVSVVAHLLDTRILNNTVIGYWAETVKNCSGSHHIDQPTTDPPFFLPISEYMLLYHRTLGFQPHTTYRLCTHTLCAAAAAAVQKHSCDKARKKKQRRAGERRGK